MSETSTGANEQQQPTAQATVAATGQRGEAADQAAAPREGQQNPDAAPVDEGDEAQADAGQGGDQAA